MGGLFSSDKKLVKAIHNRFTLEEVKLLHQEFKAFSVGGKGKKMDQAGLAAYFDLSHCGTTPIVARLFEMFALPKGKKKPKTTITFAHWVQGIVITSRGQLAEQWEFLFRLFDHDRDDYLSPKELRHVVNYFMQIAVTDVAPTDLGISHLGVQVEDHPDVQAAVTQMTQLALSLVPGKRPGVHAAAAKNTHIPEGSIDLPTFIKWMQRLSQLEKIELPWLRAVEPAPTVPQGAAGGQPGQPGQPGQAHPQHQGQGQGQGQGQDQHGGHPGQHAAHPAGAAAGPAAAAGPGAKPQHPGDHQMAGAGQPQPGDRQFGRQQPGDGHFAGAGQPRPGDREFDAHHRDEPAAAAAPGRGGRGGGGGDGTAAAPPLDRGTTPAAIMAQH